MMTPTALFSSGAPSVPPVYAGGVASIGTADAEPVSAYFAAILAAAMPVGAAVAAPTDEEALPAIRAAGATRSETPETPGGVIPAPIDPPSGPLFAKLVAPGRLQPEATGDRPRPGRAAAIPIASAPMVTATPRRAVTPDILWAIIDGSVPLVPEAGAELRAVETPVGAEISTVAAPVDPALAIIAAPEKPPAAATLSDPAPDRLASADSIAAAPVRSIPARVRLRPVFDVAPKASPAVVMPPMLLPMVQVAPPLAPLPAVPLRGDGVGYVTPPGPTSLPKSVRVPEIPASRRLPPAVVGEAALPQFLPQSTSTVAASAKGVGDKLQQPVAEAPAAAETPRGSDDDAVMAAVAPVLPVGDDGVEPVGVAVADVVVASMAARSGSPAYVPVRPLQSASLVAMSSTLAATVSPPPSATLSPPPTATLSRGNQRDPQLPAAARGNVVAAAATIDSGAPAIGIDPVPPRADSSARPVIDAMQPPPAGAAAPGLETPAHETPAHETPAPVSTAPDASAPKPAPIILTTFAAPASDPPTMPRIRAERARFDSEPAPASGAGIRLPEPGPLAAVIAPNLNSSASVPLRPEAAPRPADAPVTMTVASDRLGDVGIGLDGGAQDLRVQLSASSTATGVLAAEAPRLLADLAANGLRLQSLDIGGGQGGGQNLSQNPGQSPEGRPRPAPMPAAAMAFAADPSREAAVRRASLSERYA